ncbi:MAG TPA: acyl-ACP desaturase [Gemmatimonadales bacterium]|nr:acyl-ACP desaturase [Gemmatimonadales bacterium]
MPLTPDQHHAWKKIEVLRDLESTVHELMARHEEKRELWFPSDLLAPEEGTDPGEHRRTMVERVRGFPDACRAALALNTLTEEGLPHFHRLLAVHLGDDSHWQNWNNLWTAEEDRHGAVLGDYMRDTGCVDQRRLEELKFEYIRAGFNPDWDKDPYRVFVYTTLQERATQQSHANTGKVTGEYEPVLGGILRRIASEEARHFTFYRRIFSEILERDPSEALVSAAHVMPAIDMPGITIPGFKEFADVIRRAGIYGPRDYLTIVQEQLAHWKIEALTGLTEAGRRAQEKLLAIPERLTRIADLIDTRSRSKSFAFDVAFSREFVME